MDLCKTFGTISLFLISRSLCLKQQYQWRHRKLWPSTGCSSIRLSSTLVTSAFFIVLCFVNRLQAQQELNLRTADVDKHSIINCPKDHSKWSSSSHAQVVTSYCSTREADSSAIIFDDSRVHNYELHFYIPNWEDTLKYYYENGEEYIPARLTYQGMILDSVGVRYKGNSSYMISRSTPKKPLKLKFDKFKKGRTFYDVKELNFSNCVNDPSYMREKISYDIARRYMPASRVTFANIFIDGELLGFYIQVEQIDKTFLARNFSKNKFNLYKASDNGSSLTYLGTERSNYESGLELKTNESLNDWSGLIHMIDRLNNCTAEEFEGAMKQCLNLDLCCRYLAFNMVLSIFDSYTGSGRNFYLYDDSTSGQFQIIPWDLNEAFGAFGNNWNVTTVDIVQVTNLDQRPLNRRILKNEALKTTYLRYIRAMIAGPACCDSISARVEKIKLIISDCVNADTHKLYSYRNFNDNIENDVTVGLGIVIPGIKSFSASRNVNLKKQLDQYLQESDEPQMHVFKVYPNYPNPFNTVTTISFSLAKETDLEVKIFNVLGEQITALIASTLAAGYHEFRWQAADMCSGIYYCRFKTGFETKMIKTLLIR